MLEDQPEFQQAVRAMYKSLKERLAPHVLVVDDSENDVIILRHSLQEAHPHIHLEWRKTPDTALSAARIFQFDIIVVDLALGSGMNGVDVFKGIRAQSTVPIVGLTGMEDNSTLVSQAMGAGMSVIFRKPLSRTAIEMLFGVVGVTNGKQTP